MTWKDEARRYMGYMQNMECKMKELIWWVCLWPQGAHRVGRKDDQPVCLPNFLIYNYTLLSMYYCHLVAL